MTNVPIMSARSSLFRIYYHRLPCLSNSDLDLVRPFSSLRSLQQLTSCLMLSTIPSTRPKHNYGYKTTSKSSSTNNLGNLHYYCCGNEKQIEKKDLNFGPFLKRGLYSKDQQTELSHSHNNSKSKTILGILTASCLCGLGFYKLFSKWTPIPIVPSVHADNHNKNNFIADVVEKAAPAVVFLEILGR